MDKSLEFGIASVLAVVFTIFLGFSVYRRTVTTNLPLRYDRKLFVGGTFFVAFLMIEAISGIYIYRLPWYYYIFVVLFLLVASPTVTLVTRRMYKRSHPNEPTNIKRPTFREAYRAANGNTDVVSLVLGITFLLALFSSQIFHQMMIYYLALPFVMGPWMLYDGSKMVRQARAGQQPYDLHWYTQYKIWFGIAAILSLPDNLVMYGPLAFVRTSPYHDQIEYALILLFVIPVFMSIFFFLRKQFLKRRHNGVSSKQS